MRVSIHLLRISLIGVISIIHECSSFQVPKHVSSTPTKTTLLASSSSSSNDNKSSNNNKFTQVAEFVEPTTGVTVKLVGSMHYNPSSIELAKNTISSLGDENKLGSVVIESCDLRWNSKPSSYPEWQQKLLYSEMQAAVDTGLRYDRPVILGDQRINVTVAKLGDGFKETFNDVFNPIGGNGWLSLLRTVNKARRDAVPTDNDKQYLGPLSVLGDPKFCFFGAPIAFFKYPLSYFTISPIQTLAFLSLFVFAESAGAETPIQQLSTVDYVRETALFLFELTIFARVYFKELIAERNKVIAKNILEQCQLYEETPNSFARFTKQMQSKIFDNNKDNIHDEDGVGFVTAAPGTRKPVFDGSGDKEVVCVVGMAHCNGIIKLLKEQRV